MLSADDILAEDDLPIEEVDFGKGRACVATLRADEYLAHLKVLNQFKAENELENLDICCYWLAATLCTPDREFLFKKPIEVFGQLKLKRLPTIMAAWLVSSRLNTFGEGEAKN